MIIVGRLSIVLLTTVLPLKALLFKDSYRMELTGLDTDCEYEVRIRAMNSQGWSPLSNPFTFKTAGTWALFRHDVIVRSYKMSFT